MCSELKQHLIIPNVLYFHQHLPAVNAFVASTTINRNLHTENATIILNNTSAPRGALIESNDAQIQLRFLLAYSPFLNLIENVLSVFKKKLRSLLREDSICNRIATVSALISVVEHLIREFLYKQLSLKKIHQFGC